MLGIPVFWRYLLLMCLLLGMELFAMSASNSIAKRSLREQYMAELQSNLDWQCGRLGETWKRLYDLPPAMERTEPYLQARELGAEEPYAHVAYLAAIQKALNTQAYLYNDSEESFLYMPQTDSVCGRTGRFVTLEHFLNAVVYTETDRQTLRESILTKKSITILPMQDIDLGGAPARCLTLVIQPRGSETTLLCLYSEKTLQNYFGFDLLPETSTLQLVADGECRMLCTRGQAQASGKSSTLTSRIGQFNLEARLQIPEAYFSGLLRESQTMGRTLLASSALLGVLLCVVLSGLFARPVRRLLLTHAGQATRRSGNEFRQLDTWMRASAHETQSLHERLMSAILSRAFSGAVLSESEEELLRTYTGLAGRRYRIAILHSDAAVNPIIKSLLFGGSSFREFFCEPVNETETGLLFVSSEENLELLRSGISSLAEWAAAEGGQMLCGVSAPSRTLSELHIAVRQAHLAMPQTDGIGFYTGGGSELHAMSWLQHERLYQSIVTGDESGAAELLHAIAEDVGAENRARDLFYNVKFVLTSAAEEMNVEMPELSGAEYAPSMLPRENFLRLEQHMHRLFAHMQACRSARKGNQQEILAWIGAHMADPTLCSQTVEEAFGISERRVREIVRQTTGISFAKYLIDIRMKHAAKLLCTTNLSISEIAETCGYQASSTFYRVFKGYFSITPNQYRSSGGADARVRRRDRERPLPELEAESSENESAGGSV